MLPNPDATEGFQLAAAEAYVCAHGTPRQVAYWKAAFGWGPVETWLFEVESLQGPTGGWAPTTTARDTASAESIAGTADVLRWLAWMHLGEDVFEVLPHTVAFLAAHQAPDGSWPDGDATLASTVRIGAYMSFLGEAPERVEAAGRFVLAQGQPAGELVQLALGLALLRALSLPGAQEWADAAYARLENRLTTPHPTGELAWINEGLVQAGCGPNDPLRTLIRAQLQGRQQPEGQFLADDPRWDIVDTTFFASRVLVTR